MGAATGQSLGKLSTADWWRVVLVAGVGTVLEVSKGAAVFGRAIALRSDAPRPR